MDDVRRLADAFTSRQGVDHAEALKIASKIVSRADDISDAARIWVTTGTMPTAPTYGGMTPQSLAEEYHPTQVLTILIGMKDYPEHAKKMLRGFADHARHAR